MDGLPQGTVTFLFTDVAGSTELVRRHGARYAELLAEARTILRRAFGAHAGVEVDTQGDSFFVAFERARDAVLAAVDAQRELARHAWPEDGAVRVRMGLHTAEPHVWAEGYVGVGVHRASRICAVGHGGQILLSRSTAGLVDDDELDGVALRDLGAHRLRGLHKAERIFQLVVDGLPTEFAPLDTLEGAGSTTETATVVFGDVEAFTPLVRELAPETLRALVVELQRAFETTLEASGGRAIAALGDGVTAAYRSAHAAVCAALELRRLVESRTWPGGTRLRINIGVATGEMVATAYGYFGTAVNRAASICGRARRGSVLLSEATAHVLDDDELVLREAADESGRPPLPFRVYEVVWTDDIPVAVPIAREADGTG